MPSSSEHKEKAERNERFLGQLVSVDDADWASVAAFYTALHLIERLSACDNLHHGGHASRGAWLARHTKHRAIRHHYQALYDAAHKARYGTLKQFQRAFPAAAVKQQLIETHLGSIDRYVVAHFAPTAPPTPAR